MARLLRCALLALALAGGAVAVSAGPAQADTGCVVYGRSPVFQQPTTGSPQVGELTGNSSHCGTPFFASGSPYDLCGGGSTWLHITNPSGWVPEACVDWAW
jgi:hypothetical protein